MVFAGKSTSLSYAVFGMECFVTLTGAKFLTENESFISNEGLTK